MLKDSSPRGSSINIAIGRCRSDFWNVFPVPWCARATARNRRWRATTPVSTTPSSRAVVASPAIRHLGLAPYEPTWRAMQRFTEIRDASTPDEIWFVEHPPVLTLGLNASREHLLAPADIPVVQIDRGGQVTYHGPGQLVIYPLIDLRRQSLGVRKLVVALENAIIAYAGALKITAAGSRQAPGVYVER